MNFICEDQVPESFNEIDPNDSSGCTLRTLTDFTLVDSNGNLVSVEKLGSDNKVVVTAFGFVLQPFSNESRDEIVAHLCTSPPLVAPDIVGETALSESVVAIVGDLDRAALAVGDTVDGYCNKTFKWYEAKIIDTSKDEVKGDRLKIHFKGWNTKHDEWVGRYSERIAALGSSAVIMKEAATKAASMIPWFNTEQVKCKIDSVCSAQSGGRVSVPVQIVGIEDWCIDYSYANPTLWIIASSGVWYRLAGSLCPGGKSGSPSDRYREVFESTAKRFACAAHVAMILLDFLPSIPKMGLNIVAEELLARSVGEFDESVMLSNWKLLVEQLSGLSPPAEWDCKVNIAKSAFISQLKRQGDSYIRGGGKPGLTHASEAGVLKTKMYLGLTTLASSSLAASGQSVEKEGLKASDKDIDIDQAALSKLKYPIEDTEYWSMAALAGASKNPFPTPAPNKQLRCPSLAVGTLLQVWSTLANFRKLLDLPYISIQCLDAFLCPGSEISSSDADCAVTACVHPVLREIHVSLLSLILPDRLKSCNDNLKISVSRIECEGEDDVPVTCFMGWTTGGDTDATKPASVAEGADGHNSLVERASSVSLENLQSYLRVGDTWAEVLRALLASSHDVALPEYLEPISECEIIVETLLADPDASAFSAPVDPERDGVPDYFILVREPIDLGTILERIRSGWYDVRNLETVKSVEKTVLETDSSLANDSRVSFFIGDRVDFYHDIIGRWYEAGITDVSPSGDVGVHIIGWDAQHDCRVESGSLRLAPLGSLSRSSKTRVSRPEQCDVPSLWSSTTLASTFDARAKSRQSKGTSSIAAESAFRPAGVDSSSGGGHEAIARDVRRVWDNCKKYMGRHSTEHPILEAAVNLSTMFENMYERKVLLPMQEATLAAARILMKSQGPESEGPGADSKSVDCEALADDWGHVIAYLGRHDYSNASVEVKLLVLSWACNELLQCAATRSFFEGVVDTYMQRTAKPKPSLPTLEAGAQDADLEAEDVQKSKKKRLSSSNSKEESQSSGGSSTGETVGDLIESSPIGCDIEMFEDMIRLRPLGRDRDCRVYWSFANINPTTKVAGADLLVASRRIFCEVPQNGDWLVFSSVEEINELYAWLNDKGVRECALKKSMTEWMLLNNVKIEKQESSATKSSNRRRKSEAVDSTVTEAPPHVADKPIDFTQWWSSRDNSCVVITTTVELGDSFQLGLGFKVFDGRVVVTNSKSDSTGRSAGSEAGIRIGDCIVVVDGKEVKDISTLQTILRSKMPVSQTTSDDSKTSSGSPAVNRSSRSIAPKSLGSVSDVASESVNSFSVALQVVLLRHTHPLLLPEMQKAIEFDVNLRSALQKQHEDDEMRMKSGAYSYFVDKVVFCTRESSLYPSRVVGLLLYLLSKAAHPFCLPEVWAVRNRQRWILELSSLVGHLDAVRQKDLTKTKKSKKAVHYTELMGQLHSKLRDCLVEFEGALCTAGNMLRRYWTKDRKRFRWRTFCLRSETFAQLSMALAVLSEAIDWDRMSSACHCLSREEWLVKTPKHIRTSIPAEHARVVYYGDGHFAEEERDASLDRPSMWGASCSTAKLRGLVLPCVVTAVRVLLCGPPEKFFPFAQIDLKVEQGNILGMVRALPRLQLSESTDFRLINKIVNLIRLSPEAVAFLEPVVQEDHPEYYSIVRKPIDLSAIRLKARSGGYRTVEVFFEDIKLLHQNCKMYCCDYYPELVEAAERLMDETDALIKLFATPPANSESLDDADNTCAGSTLPPGCLTPNEEVSLANSSSNEVGSALKGIGVDSDRLIGLGSQFTVCIRLSSAEICPYLVPLLKYEESSVAYRLGSQVKSIDTLDPSTSLSRVGTIIGSRPQPVDGKVPWKWLQVEWADDSSESVFVNPWEIELVTVPARHSTADRAAKRARR